MPRSGPALLTWKIDPTQPHWNTATNTPKAAPMESRFMIAAVSGMTMLRNTIVNNRNESTTTRPMNRGSFDVEHPGEVHEDGGVASDVDADAGAGDGGGDGLGAEVVDQVGGGWRPG